MPHCKPSTSTSPDSLSRPGRTIARRNLCSQAQAVSYEPKASARCRPSALTPPFWLVMYQAAANQSVSGERVPAKIVPAVAEVRRSHAAQR